MHMVRVCACAQHTFSHITYFTENIVIEIFIIFL